MRVLWEKQTATVSEITDVLSTKRRVHYSTVQTLLRILETKGYVAHEKSGRAFTYRPVINQQQARRRALRHLVSRLFNNSPTQLVMNVLEDHKIDPGELELLKRLIKDA